MLLDITCNTVDESNAISWNLEQHFFYIIKFIV